jgi:hypothetical protein
MMDQFPPRQLEVVLDHHPREFGNVHLRLPAQHLVRFRRVA